MIELISISEFGCELLYDKNIFSNPDEFDYLYCIACSMLKIGATTPSREYFLGKAKNYLKVVKGPKVELHFSPLSPFMEFVRR